MELYFAQKTALKRVIFFVHGIQLQLNVLQKETE